ncbi:GNAT family N-acetyltransferase [Acidaminobacter sp. JC074]|uniref:GNAT family N-acetyltransferase n=1 Tax=Acidaminobacter sp. JC074 TaxID=2530199 RepID=UPI001F0DFFD2|nr:GNAT family N-acetyltransferase [Acidaminobacter sp. JC074]
MKFKIFNPKEDMQGNRKENIFIVMDENGYIGNGYVYPKLTTITPDHPINIFMDLSLSDEHLYHEIGFELFHLLRKRALDLFKGSGLNKGLIYYGTEKVDEKYHFFRDQGFKEELPTYLMSGPTNIGASPIDYAVTTDEVYNDQMVELHNKYLLKPIDHEVIHALSHKDDYCCFQVYDDKLIASMIVYKDHNVGWIDHIVVDKAYKHKGIGRYLMHQASEYFKKRLITQMSLEVWSENTYAVDFYQRLGFENKSVTEHYIGILLDK